VRLYFEIRPHLAKKKKKKCTLGDFGLFSCRTFLMRKYALVLRVPPPDSGFPVGFMGGGTTPHARVPRPVAKQKKEKKDRETFKEYTCIYNMHTKKTR
jgi:hypothetical protein